MLTLHPSYGIIEFLCSLCFGNVAIIYEVFIGAYVLPIRDREWCIIKSHAIYLLPICALEDDLHVAYLFFLRHGTEAMFAGSHVAKIRCKFSFLKPNTRNAFAASVA